MQFYKYISLNNIVILNFDIQYNFFLLEINNKQFYMRNSNYKFF